MSKTRYDMQHNDVPSFSIGIFGASVKERDKLLAALVGLESDSYLDFSFHFDQMYKATNETLLIDGKKIPYKFLYWRMKLESEDRFRSINAGYDRSLRGKQAAVVVFSADEAESFENAKKEVEYLKNNPGIMADKIFLVAISKYVSGNAEAAKGYAKSREVTYLEYSLRNPNYLQDFKEQIVTQTLPQYQKLDQKTQKNPSGLFSVTQIGSNALTESFLKNFLNDELFWSPITKYRSFPRGITKMQEAVKPAVNLGKLKEIANKQLKEISKNRHKITTQFYELVSEAKNLETIEKWIRQKYEEQSVPRLK